MHTHAHTHNLLGGSISEAVFGIGGLRSHQDAHRTSTTIAPVPWLPSAPRGSAVWRSEKGMVTTSWSAVNDSTGWWLWVNASVPPLSLGAVVKVMMPKNVLQSDVCAWECGFGVPPSPTDTPRGSPTPPHALHLSPSPPPSPPPLHPSPTSPPPTPSSGGPPPPPPTRSRIPPHPPHPPPPQARSAVQEWVSFDGVHGYHRFTAVIHPVSVLANKNSCHKLWPIQSQSPPPGVTDVSWSDAVPGLSMFPALELSVTSGDYSIFARSC